MADRLRLAAVLRFVRPAALPAVHRAARPAAARRARSAAFPLSVGKYAPIVSPTSPRHLEVGA